MWTFLISGFILGLIGSGHCMGMCGPVVLALPKQGIAKNRLFVYHALYNLGRILTYAVLGILFGLAGSGLRLAGLQQWLSIGLGILMLLSVLLPVIFSKNSFFTTLVQSFNGLLIRSFGRHLSAPGTFSFLIIGLLNGLLPCGLVYVALASAIESSHYLSGMLFMAAFGLGTSPMLYSFGVISGMAGQTLRSKLKHILPWIVVLVGIVFILRGSGLGIKFLSPPEKALEIHQTGHSCH